MNLDRVRKLREGNTRNGAIVYWMQRDQRVDDNWALIYAYNIAIEKNEKLIVIFNLVNDFLGASYRQYYFMIEGLKEIAEKLNKLNIQFVILTGNPEKTIPEFLIKNKISCCVSDFNPLRIVRGWKEIVNSKIDIPFYEVDAHNIVPVWCASKKLEYAAYTIRPKINKLLPDYLDEFPRIKKMKSPKLFENNISWNNLYSSLKIDKTINIVPEFIPGSKAAGKVLKSLVENKLENYNNDRNDPNKKGLSNLSPYLHFGHLSAQRIALVLNDFKHNDESVASFLEELIVRRELSDNFCFYNPNYDNFEGFHSWAQTTLHEHRKDKREYLYSLEEFELAKTHDLLWNAAQVEMVKKGKMHGYMRMYWAKKILEWTNSPEQALEFGIYLNDKYELDGRDPNGYVGLAWSIGGIHDRAWSERPVFGKIRYMNFNGCKRKFDVQSYINRHLSENLF